MSVTASGAAAQDTSNRFEAALYAVGLNGRLSPWRAPSLAEGLAHRYSLDMSTLDAAYHRGLVERARAAVRFSMDERYPRLDAANIDVRALMERAAKAADLEPAEIVSIVRELAPEACAAEEEGSGADWLLWLAEDALRDFQRVPANLRSPLRLATVDGEPVEPAPEVKAEPRRHSCERVDTNGEHATAAFDLVTEPGLLGDLARWSQTYAFRPVVEFAVPAALATLAASFGRRWATPTGLGLNLYLIGIGETGGGKDALLGAPKALLPKAGMRHLVGPGDFTSDAALETSLRMHPSQLMPLDEVGKLCQAMMGRNAASWARLAAKALLEIYPRSQPGSEWSGKQRADPARDNAAEPIYSPTLSILGVSTPEGFFEGMSQQTLEDGFLNRLTVFRAGKAGPRQRDAARLEPPAALIDALRAAYSASEIDGNLSEAARRSAGVQPTIRFARWADDEAIAALEKIEDWEDAAREAGRNGVAGRAAEQTQKMATLRALSRSPGDPALTAEDLRWAFEIVSASIETIEHGAASMMAGSEFESLCNAIEGAVAKAGPDGLPMSVLLRAKGVGKHDDRAVEAALKRLQKTKRIWAGIGTSGKSGRPTQRVRIVPPEE